MPEPVSLLLDIPVAEPLALSAPAGIGLFEPVLLFMPMLEVLGLVVLVLGVALGGLDMSPLMPVFDAGVVDLSMDELPVEGNGIVVVLLGGVVEEFCATAKPTPPTTAMTAAAAVKN
jgi:hypothetical protein